MSDKPQPSWLDLDHAHVWHPYASVTEPAPVFPVASAEGVRLHLSDGRELIDGMASWWCAIHGYNHPALNAAASEQISRMSHVMFGGLTNEPAVRLAERLVNITPPGLEHVFLADSGSVSIEVAIKMALQYWQGRGEHRPRLVSLRGGYHGDTLGAMSVCDPVNGMHRLFSGLLPEQLFAPRPECRRDEDFSDDDIAPMRALLEAHGHEVAAVIAEPLVQGAGGMHFYCGAYLRALRRLCDEHGVLLIFDEIATGFGRTGSLFASDAAGVTPDILSVGKAITGGYMTLAATLCTPEVARGISARGVLMHGPTFMGNPLACAVANASIDLLLAGPWQERVAGLGRALERGLAPARALANVHDVRVFGGIGVIEMHEPADMTWMQPRLVERGVWVRPFGRLLYVMPAYIMEDSDLDTLTSAMVETVAEAGER